MHRLRLLLICCFLLASNVAWAQGEDQTTKLSVGALALKQECTGCIESRYRLIPLGIGVRQGEYSMSLATNLMELHRPEIDERYSGYSETLLTFAHQQRLQGRRLWGSEIKLKLPTESEPELGNGSTDVEFSLKGMAGLGTSWLSGKLAQRWRQGDTAEALYDTRSVELGITALIGEHNGAGLRAVYRDKSASIDVSERELMPYLSFRLGSRQRATLYLLHSEQGSSRKSGAGLHYSYQISL